jgi:membrane protein implicated in regulation of membrane protease activity
VSAVFILAEIFTSGFVLLWVGVGALVAAISALLGAGLPIQLRRCSNASS